MEREFTNKSKVHIKNLIQKEVYLRTEIAFKDLNFIIDGRCDGLLFREDVVTIDEIKSTALPLAQLEK